MTSRVSKMIRRRVVVALALDGLNIALLCALAATVGGVAAPVWWKLILLTVGIRCCSMSCVQVYRVSWYLFCYRDAVRLSFGWLLSTPLLALAWWWLTPWQDLSTFVQALAVETGLGYLAVTGMRAFARGKTELAIQATPKLSGAANKRAVVVGAGSAATMTIRELGRAAELGYEVVGIVDDDPKKWGVDIAGIRVHGSIKEIEDVVERCNADCIVLAMPSVRGDRIKAILSACKVPGVPVYTVPAIKDLLTGRVQISSLRPLEIGDLLGRQQNRLNAEQWDKVVAKFAGKRFMVTGAGGSIGSELCRQLSALSPEALIMVENNENNLFEIHQELKKRVGDVAKPNLVDIQDRERLAEVYETHQPQVVFHAAAFKHVPMMELHPREAIDNNVRGTQNVAELAHEHQAEHFVQISTDKAVNPANIMGATKRIAEMIVQSLAASSSTKFSCVRFGNVLGSRGSVLHTFKQQIEQGGPVTVTDPEVTRFFMTIPEAVSLVIQAGAHGQGGEVFLLDMGEPVKIVDLARSMIRLSGYSENEIPIAFVGLRPGEKLYEELLLSGEGVKPSGLPKIHLASCASVEARKVRDLIELLRNTASSGDERRIRHVLVGAGIGFRPGASAEEEDRSALAQVGASQLSLGALREQIQSGGATNRSIEKESPELRSRAS